ncbi:MAG: MBL fold metallo-hydrolase [Bryobacteraceae bacterium]
MLEITWLGHGTFKFRLDSGEVLAMDRWVEGNPLYPPGHEFDRVDDQASGYALRFAEGRTVYFSGDTNVLSDMSLMRELYQPSLAFLPVGDLYTMSPREAATACRVLTPVTVVPMHFGTFPPLTGRPSEVSARIANLPGTTVWELAPGKPVEW